MVATAQFCALAAIDTRLFNASPAIRNKAWNRVLLPTQIRNPPRVNNIPTSKEESDLLAGRNDEGMINLQEVVGDFGWVNA